MRWGRPLKANGGVWPPVKTPEKVPANNGKPLKQGTTFKLEKKNGICLPLTAGTYLGIKKKESNKEWCFNACKAKAKAQGKTCDRFIFRRLGKSSCWWEHGNCTGGF